jgi:hypothetical protein
MDQTEQLAPPIFTQGGKEMQFPKPRVLFGTLEKVQKPVLKRGQKTPSPDSIMSQLIPVSILI